jgi:hypothetical protein
MRFDAATVEEYLESLPDDRRAAVERVRDVILEHLPEGYVETMNWGMISYEVPPEIHPDTYNGQPLLYAGLASQKRHMAVYLSGVYADPDALEAFTADYGASGKPLDMGKSCVRFTEIENLPLEVIGRAIARWEVAEFVAVYEASRRGG